MKQPIWYTKSEQILLAHGRPAITASGIITLRHARRGTLEGWI